MQVVQNLSEFSSVVRSPSCMAQIFWGPFPSIFFVSFFISSFFFIIKRLNFISLATPGYPPIYPPGYPLTYPSFFRSDCRMYYIKITILVLKINLYLDNEYQDMFVIFFSKSNSNYSLKIISVIFLSCMSALGIHLKKIHTCSSMLQHDGNKSEK